MIIPVKGRVTADFNEKRPLSVTPSKRDHNHGAVDISATIGTNILAPERGVVFFMKSNRNDNTRLWQQGPYFKPIDPAFYNYFYDTYGGVTLLFADTGRLHVFTHSYFNQMYSMREREAWSYFESKKDERWPLEVMHTFNEPLTAHEGEVIAKVGNAGFSTGAHVHWEIHPTWKYAPHADRIDPAVLFGGSLC